MQFKFQKDMRETDRKDISTLDSLISAATKITTISHIRPDGDAVGSRLNDGADKAAAKTIRNNLTQNESVGQT